MVAPTAKYRIITEAWNYHRPQYWSANHDGGVWHDVGTVNGRHGWATLWGARRAIKRFDRARKRYPVVTPVKL